MKSEEALYKRLRVLRHTRGLSVKRFAEAIGVPISTYREWEYGRGLRLPPIVKMSEVLQVSIEELLTGDKFDPQGVGSIINELEMLVIKLKKLKLK